MTSDRFYDPYISFVFPSGLYLCVYETKHKHNWIVWIKPCLNLFSDFFGNCTTCLSFYWSRPACLSKAFFFGVNTILLFAGLTCHLRPRLSCLLFRQNAKYRQDASFSFFSKSTLNLSARLSCWLFNSCKNAKSSRGGNKATKCRGRSSDIYAICSFEPLTYQLGGRNILLVKYFENFPISTFLFFLAMWSDSPARQQGHPPCQRPPIAQSRVLILSSNWKWVNSGETQKVEFCWSKFSRCW